MPRIRAKKKEYMIEDFAKWVKGEIRANEFRLEDVAEKLGITPQALSNRMNQKKYKSGEMKDPFSYGDMLTLFKLFGTDAEEIKRLLTLRG